MTYSYTDGNGCTISDSSLIEVVDLNSVDINSLQLPWISPNPATEWLTLHNLRTNSEISVIDLSGRVLIQKSTLATEEILNVSRLTPGMYLLKVGNLSIPWIKY